MKKAARRPAAKAAAAQTTRSRVVSAACDEFGSRGFAATTVERIARRARVNKAMIYYHFPSKRALYLSIVRDLYAEMGDRLAAIAAKPLSPERKLDALIAALVDSVDRSRHFLPIFLREIADGAVHLGAEELRLIAAIFASVRGVIAEGVRLRRFHDVNPALAHFTIIGPLVMFRATAPVRERISATQHVAIPDVDSATLIAHLQMVASRMLSRASEPEKDSL